MLLICFYLAAFVLVATVCLVCSNRRVFNRAVRIMLIGIVAIITILMFPMYRASYDVFTSTLFSFLYALRSLSGCQGVDTSHKILIEGWLYYGYYTLLYAAFITAPIFTTSFLISIFGNLNDKIRYAILPGKELHVFSRLDESSVLLCESLVGHKRRFVFCNTKLSSSDKDSEIVQRARKVGAIILDTSELDIKIRKKRVWFYQINSSKDYNINSTIALIEKYRDDTDREIHIATFSTGITAELLLDSVQKRNIQVKLLDEVKYSCYALLDQMPLFDGAKDNKISALIIGCDYTGTEMLKAIMWCGQVTGYRLEINVIDKCADLREKEFTRACPSVDLSYYGIRFIKADVNTSDFELALDQYCQDTSYVVVITGDDRINIDTAIFLRKYFLRRDKNHFHNRPKINLRVRDALKNKQMEALCNASIDAYALFAFGSVEKTFNINNLMSSPLEKMAIGVHLAYYNALSGTDEQIHKAMEEYYLQEYRQRSSFAVALHIKYKMFACGIQGISGQPVSEEQIKEFEAAISDPAKLEMLAKLEHNRWSAFMRSEGYSTAAREDVQVYYPLGKFHSHVHQLAKLHPSLVEWDSLDQVSADISTVTGTNFDFKKSDFDIVKRLPAILRLQSSNITYWG